MKTVRKSWLPGLVLLVVVLAAWVAIAPIPRVAAPAAGAPAVDYADAVARFNRIRAAESPVIRPRCLPQLLTHGRKVERAIVLLHGFTNCPAQFDSLAPEFYELGYNVVIPRLPRHGLADRMTGQLALLRAEDLIASADSAVDLARGLGERVSILGLSSSGVAAAWLGQHRADLDEAIILAPAFGPHGMSDAVARRATSALLVAPNMFVWWDSNLKERLLGPTHCYPRFASRALAQVYRLGFALQEAARTARPAARRLVVITTACDEGVNNDPTRDLVRLWREHGAEVTAYDFPESLHVRHDMLEPEQPYAQVGVTYPVILRLTTGE